MSGSPAIAIAPAVGTSATAALDRARRHGPTVSSRLAAALMSLPHLAACGGAPAAHESSRTDGGDFADRSPCSHSGDSFVAGMLRASSGGAFFARLAEIDPAPPSMGKNIWRLTLTNGADQPLAGATVVMTSFMPDHFHPGPSIDVLDLGGGDYRATMSIVLMSGLYRFSIALGSRDEESASYEFCVR